jgi:PAS domain S-box-containing protein
MRWSTEKKIFIIFALTFLLVVSVGIVAYQHASQTIETHQRVIHTRDVLDALDAILVDMLNAESGHRGYILTGRSSYLEPYNFAISSLGGQLYYLRNLISDNPAQRERLNNLQSLVDARLDIIRVGLGVYSSRGPEAAQHTILTDRGKDFMDTIREVIATMKATENELLESRTEVSQATGYRTLLVTVVLSILSFGTLVLAFYTINRDITNRKRLTASLEIERGLLHSLMDNMPDAIYFKDTQSRFTRINRAHAAFLGLRDPSEAVGKTDANVQEVELASQFLSEEQEIITTGKPVIDRLEFNPGVTGQPQWFSTTKVPLLDKSGQITGIVGMSRSVTEREKSREEMAKLNRELATTNQDLESFSYSISHDLRAPVRAVDSFSRILLDNYAANLPPDGLRYLEKVRNNARKMGDLIDDLLLFSRLSRKVIETRKVDFTQIVSNVLEDLRTERENRQVEIVVGDLPPGQGDSSLLTQVFMNLIGNALKYTRPRTVARVEIGSQRTNGQPTTYFVRDNGVGFDMTYSDKLFGVFQRLHTDREFEGTGVGLAIVHHIIQRHNGRIWAEAAINEGATFYFTLGGPNV